MNRHSKLWISLRKRINVLTRPPTPPPTVLPILKFPYDIILCIFDYLPPTTVLKFALCSREAHDLVAPALNTSIIITERNVAFFMDRAINNDPRNQYVRRVIFVGSFNHCVEVGLWDISDVAYGVLSTFPQLEEVDTLCVLPLGGSRGLRCLSGAVGERLKVLKVRMVDAYLMNVVVRFPNVTSLTFQVDGEIPVEPHLKVTLQDAFPSLNSLEVVVHFQLSNLDPLLSLITNDFTDTTTSCLQHLRIFIPPYFSIHPREVMSEQLLPFLLRHATTLRSLHLPYYLIPPATTCDLSSLHLRELSVNMNLEEFLVKKCSLPTEGVARNTDALGRREQTSLLRPSSTRE